MRVPSDDVKTKSARVVPARPSIGWTARTWREWFFHVFAPNGYIRPLNPLPMTDAQQREHAERAEREIPDDITRLNPPRRC
jgi:hypothetical protein